MTDYFGRVYELIIRTDDGLIRRFDGVPTEEHTPLQITFSIDQTPSAHRAYGEIVVYGLNQNSRKQIYEQFSSVVLRAGYRDAVATIFDGQIENVEIGREGPDTFVKLFCQSAAGIWGSTSISKTWGRNTPQAEIIRDVASTFGLPVEVVGDFDSLPRALKGRTIDMDSKQAMNMLAESFGFEWFASGDRMFVVLDGSQTPDQQVFNYKPTNGLIGSPEITQRGVDIDVLLNPFVRPWDVYTVESETAQLTFNGIYYQQQQFPKTNGESRNQVISLVHEGDFYGDTWQTKIEGRRLDG